MTTANNDHNTRRVELSNAHIASIAAQHNEDSALMAVRFQQDHGKALDEDAQRDETAIALAGYNVFSTFSPAYRQKLLTQVHAIALRMNAAHDWDKALKAAEQITAHDAAVRAARN